MSGTIAFNNKLETIYQDGDTKDIIKVIMKADRDNIGYPEGMTRRFEFNQYSDFFQLWDFVKSNINYKEDRRGHEIIKSPAALWAKKEGDCKSFSLFIASILKFHGIKVKYRFVAYPGDKDFTHVYPIAIWKGQQIILDAVHTTFDEEVSHSYRKDINANLPKGLRGIASTGSDQWWKYILMGLGVYILLKR